MSEYDYDRIAHTCSSQEILRVMLEQRAEIENWKKSYQIRVKGEERLSRALGDAGEEIERLRAENEKLMERLIVAEGI